MTLIDELKKVRDLRGDTYSTAEILGLVSRAVNEIEELTRQIDSWKTRAMAILMRLLEADAEKAIALLAEQRNQTNENTQRS